MYHFLSTFYRSNLIESLFTIRVVTVPSGTSPGQTLLIQHPSANGQVISAAIPEGHYAGNTFYVRFPPLVVVSGTPVGNPQLTGQQQSQTYEPAQQQQSPQPGGGGQSYAPPPALQQQQGKKKYKRCSEEMLLLHKKGLVKIKVPPNLQAGDKMRVQIPDGRMINVVVPSGNVSEFQVKVPPKKQNWHDNPIAVHAPMALGPLLM
jgi:hypothetical protein